MLFNSAVYLLFLYLVKLISPFLVLPIISGALPEVDMSFYINFMAITGWMVMIVEFGFIYSGTRSIAKTDLKSTIEKKVYGIVNAQLLLCAVVLLLMSIFVVSLKSIKGQYFAAVISFVTIVATGFLPIYYYHAKHKIKKYTLMEACCAFGFFLLIYILGLSEDLTLENCLFAFMFSRLCLLLFCWMDLRKDFNYFRVSFCDGIRTIKKSIASFLFKASASLYGSASVILLGVILDARDVSIYLIADRLVRAYQGLLTPISQAAFPILSKNTSYNGFWGIVLIQLAIAILGVVAFQFCSSMIITFLYGESFNDAADLASVLAFILPLIAVSNMLGVNNLLAKGHDRLFSSVIVISALFSVCLLYPSVLFFGVGAAAYVILFTELSILLLFILFSVRTKNV